MRVISNRALVDFASAHPEAHAALQAWRQILQLGSYPSFAALRRSFNSVDRVGDYHVFNVGGNKVRVVAALHFNRQMVFIRHVFTHKEYDLWKP